MSSSKILMAAAEPVPEMPTFSDFYAATNPGRSPFPWQARLANRVLNEGRWPAEIGIPTGLGKTSCLDIAIWWLAADAHLDPRQRTAPTRIWWVVNRRLLVDAVADHAERIRCLLSAALQDAAPAQHEVLRNVALRLQRLAAVHSSEPLQVFKLRGGASLGRPSDPSQPSIILSTVPMFGSRLLFRGYGSSRSMRPIDAALAGTDSLVLVDEAHLAVHLRKLIPALRGCMPPATPVLRNERSGPQVVSLTATGDLEVGRFELDKTDHANEIVKQRLDASKRLEVRRESRGSRAKHLANAVLDLLDRVDGTLSCVVFANAPATARQVYSLLKPQRDRQRLDLLLVTGQTREPNAEEIRHRILDEKSGAPSNRAQLRREKSLVVVATQTLEVGADVDFEYLVTEQCGARALIQRLGRLNRLGRFSDSRAIYMHLPPTSSEGKTGDGWPVYGQEPTEVLSRLERAQGLASDIDVSPRVVARVVGEPRDNPGIAPEVLPALLWEWIKTTTPPPGEAPVEPYFAGIADVNYSMSLMWRCHVPSDGERLWPRPRDLETIDVSVAEFRDAIEGNDVARLCPDGITIQHVAASRLRPGDTIVLPVDRGLLDEFGWAPGSSAIVSDLSLIQSGLPIDAKALRLYCGADMSREVARTLQSDVGERDDDERAAAVAELVEHLRDYPPLHQDESDWSAFLKRLRPQPVDADGEISRLVLRDSEDLIRYDEFDEVSLASEATHLDRHGQAVGERAHGIAAALGIEPSLVALIRRAGDYHDLGKADVRFQRWLNDGEPSDPALAKSRLNRGRWSSARDAAGWPRGGRHEELSVRLVQDWLSQRGAADDTGLDELLLHLIVSHHGRGRPLVVPVSDGTSTVVEYQIDGISVTAYADLSIADWEQPERFARLNERYGPWGLALFEAIVRQADHLVSASGEVR